MNGKHKFLVAGIGVANVSFILDTFNIYCRHWCKGYSLNDVIEVACILLFCLSLILLLVYLIQFDKQKLMVQKRSSIVIGSIYLLCLALQVISNYINHFTSIPWGCIGYIFFCGIQFTYLFRKNEEVNEERIESKEEKAHEFSINTEEEHSSIIESVDSEQLINVDKKELVESNEIDKKIQLLTTRELEIAKYVCEGKSNKEIAEILFISQNTVRNHIYNLYKKLDVKNKIELINMFK